MSDVFLITTVATLPAPLPPHPSLPRSRLPRAEAEETGAADVTGATNGDDIDL